MLETLANLGEFVGGVAVLVTIVYFAVQLRANLNANRAQAVAAWITAAQAEKEALYRDPSFSRLYWEVVYEEKVPEADEAVRFYAFCIQFMNSWQLAYWQCQLGIMNKPFLEKASVGYAGFVVNAQVKRWWESSGCAMYDEEFVDFVNERINRAAS